MQSQNFLKGLDKESYFSKIYSILINPNYDLSLKNLALAVYKIKLREYNLTMEKPVLELEESENINSINIIKEHDEKINCAISKLEKLEKRLSKKVENYLSSFDRAIEIQRRKNEALQRREEKDKLKKQKELDRKNYLDLKNEIKQKRESERLKIKEEKEILRKRIQEKKLAEKTLETQIKQNLRK